MVNRSEAEMSAARLEAEIADVCGLLNATTARLVRLIADVLATGSWEGWRVRSPEHWVAWKCGVSPGRARQLVTMARRLGELPQTTEAFGAGELTEDQVAVVCRHAPAAADAEAAGLARRTTVAQLRRALGGYSFQAPVRPERQATADGPPKVSFGYTDTGSWHLSASLAADEGALVERALLRARRALVDAGDRRATWPDALVALAERAAGGGRGGGSATVLLHVDRQGSHLHLGPAVAEGLGDYLSCDSRVRVLWEERGKAVSVGRSSRTVPGRTRTVVEERDRGCRVPGCPRTHWIHVHHIKHWRHGGATDTANLLALCSKHHRLLHLGHLRIEGNADEPDGLVFRNHWGHPLADTARPRAPATPLEEAASALGIPAGRWVHPSGESLDAASVFIPEQGAA